jgi:hypothetical protein
MMVLFMPLRASPWGIRHLCTGLAGILRMVVAPTLPDSVTYTISQTANGWLLVMENPHCSLSQLFHSSDSAQQAVGRTAFALETLTAQHLEARLLKKKVV